MTELDRINGERRVLCEMLTYHMTRVDQIKERLDQLEKDEKCLK